MENKYLIGELSKIVNMNPKTIRYYEQIGLLPKAERCSNNYRIYSDKEARLLKFIKNARCMDMNIKDIFKIITYWEHDEAPCDYVLETLDNKINEIELKIKKLRSLSKLLQKVKRLSSGLPTDDTKADKCVCALIRTIPLKQNKITSTIN